MEPFATADPADPGPARARTTTAGAVLELLAAAGVTTAFGLPGTHNLAFWRAARAGAGTPRIVGVRHEQTAGYAADGYARAGGGLGVALTTSGPGTANAVAAFGEAWASGSPVLLIASEPPVALRRADRVRGVLHEIGDQAALFSQMAKAVYRTDTPLAAIEAVGRAMATAMSTPRGPVYVGIPADVLDAPAPAAAGHRGDRSLLVQVTEPPQPAPGALDAALEILGKSRRPVVWVGGGAVQSNAAAAVTDLAWRLGAPVVTTFAARGLLPAGHPLLVDAPVHEPEVAELLGSADVLVALGTAFEGMTTKNWTLPIPSRVIEVNTDPAHLERAGRAQVAMLADVRLTCERLAVRLPERAPWADSVFLIGPQVRARLASDPRTAGSIAMLEAIDGAWPGSGPIVCDMAVAGYWAGGYAARRFQRTLQYPVGWGTLGYALPAAVGAAATRPAGPVLVVAGDGGVAMALGELATLVQEHFPVTLLLVDDGGYGMLRFDEISSGMPASGLDLAGPDWLAVAAAFGIAAEDVAGAGSALEGALERAAVAGGPRLVLLRERLHPPRTTSPRWSE
jgi:thiamine pyrophosphate-dependent acetolactate synthase large subunit-like protein